MTRYAMMIDLDDCVGCQACVTSCRERWDTGAGATRNWVHTYETGSRGKDLDVTFYPGLCMQCAEHPCTIDCPTGATFMNENGVIVVDPDLCIGCGNCVAACPYGARSVDPVKKIVEKCDLCAPFVARGEQPACVTTCLAECRIFGDLDDPDSELVTTIAAREAKAIVTPEAKVTPKVVFAGAAARERIVAAGAVRKPEVNWFTRLWTETSLPFSRIVPLVPVMAAGAGVLVNFTQRKERVAAVERAEKEVVEELPRHRLGMRLLHWFNALTWVALLATGLGLIASPRFAFFGVSFPRWAAAQFGGAETMLRFHILWGLIWAAVIVPVFLLYKKGGLKALHEVRLRSEDFRWLMLKPLAMMGLAKQPLPPQEKYNAGQKIFAITALIGTATIIATGLVMTFHIGGADVVAAAILLHKLAIAFAIIGLAVHITMAAILREERPALKSMITGRIDREHAETHNEKWVEKIDQRRKQ